MADWPLTSDLGPLGALATVPRLARGFVSVTLNGWGLDALVDVTELLVSELSTNVVRAAMTPEGAPQYDADGKLPLLWIRLLCDRAHLLIEVWDTLPAALGAPVTRHPDPDEESGRGLEIIETLAEEWGWETVPGWAGKKVWALLKVTQLPARLGARQGTVPGRRGGRPQQHAASRTLSYLIWKIVTPPTVVVL
ncbi:MAG TPA: ATP-binding protein [Trebonia sp.]|nr:ATP-binding protein [Trebonia sp.]